MAAGRLQCRLAVSDWRNSMDKSQNAGRAGYYLYIIPGMLGFTLVVLVPLIANFVISFTTWKGGNIAPRYVGLENYQRLLADTVFWSSIQHTVLFIISMTIVPILLGLVLAAVLFDYISAQFSETWSSFFRA